MNFKRKILPLKGVVQHYDWGGKEFIPTLLGVENPDNLPFAEYWMGAHASAPSFAELDNRSLETLSELISKEPGLILGEKVKSKFGSFPYLFKILDVEKMLSIQVHPSKTEAIKGFENEEAKGIPINAPDRNYKDKNHKPEVMVALSDFWLLHGFKMKEELGQVLNSKPSLRPLVEVFDKEGYSGLYKKVMEMPIEEADKILLPLVEDAIGDDQHKIYPGYWINKWYNGQMPSSNLDKGIFSIYFFNIVQLLPGQAIFQGAGVPHAYLQGQNIELMANSDNVLRGGLTSKHIDVPELLKHIAFEGIEPQVIEGEKTGALINYSLPAEDFALSSIILSDGEIHHSTASSPEIFIVMNGVVDAGENKFSKGEAFLILPGAEYFLKGIETSELFKAYVP